MHSQLGFLVLLCDATDKTNILHFASYKSKRVVRSVIGGKCHAFADAFYYGYSPRHDLEQMLDKTLPLQLHTDSDSVFKVIVKNSSTTERRLMIDLEATREAYGSHDIDDIHWVRSGDNPADCLIKAGVCDLMTPLVN